MRLARTSACSGVSGTAGSRFGCRPRGLAAAPAAATAPAPPSAAVPPSAAGACTLLGRPPLLTRSELELSQSLRRRLLMPSQHVKMALMSACCFQSPLLPGSPAHFSNYSSIKYPSFDCGSCNLRRCMQISGNSCKTAFTYASKPQRRVRDFCVSLSDLSELGRALNFPSRVGNL